MKVALHSLSTKAPSDLQKEEVKEETKSILKELSELQNLLYASDQHSILVILQGIDASGKDGAVRNIFSSLNPQGVNVYSFKVPNEKELSHDFLWRIHAVTPPKRMISVFNRSHYEDVLSPRLNGNCNDQLALQRMEAINNFEALLANHNNTHILKFYLHISAEEQKKRLEERMTDPTKQWKYQANDWKVAEQYPAYLKLYEDIFEHCNDIPWHIVPSDQNWYKEYLIASTLHKTLKKLDMKYPAI
jgi:PPK2 family polyphosphate:nucleotide phosphotransferase